MTEPNHDLTDSEAQAFQPEPHVMHLLQRAAKRVPGVPPSSSSDRAADAHGGNASGEPGGDSTSSGPP
jgi:hypothetical protein